MTSPVNMSTEELMLTILIEIVIIVSTARIFGTISRRLGQPQVCGEIAAGLILGPSLLGGWFPRTFESIFHPAAQSALSVVSQIGLILLMFLIGLEFDFGHLRTHRRAALAISAAGILIPFGLGLAISGPLYRYTGASANRIGFSLFVATALSITAVPVLGRIMIEFNIQRTRVGSLAITAAALNDAAGWIILALITAIVRSQFDYKKTILMILNTLIYGFLMIFVGRRLLLAWVRSVIRTRGRHLSLNDFAILLVVIFGSAAITNWIGIFSIIGAFLAGALLYDQDEFREAVRLRLQDFVTVFFLPIFFTFTGLRTDIGSMRGILLWSLFGVVLLAALIGKFGGATGAARLSGLSWRESCSIGVLMNTRGLMELIVINAGYDLGVIPKNVFFMLVAMAVVTTYMTPPLLRRLIRGDNELETSFQSSTVFAAKAAGR